MKNTMIGVIGAAAFGVMASAASAATLDDVKAKGLSSAV
jgi:general L-amino acid transport system substrate-binding protein